MPDKSLVTLAELSETSRLSTSTIRRLVRAKRIPFVQPSGKRGKLLFPPDAIERTSPAPSAGSVTSTPLAGRRPFWMNDNS
jgi:excisionase family DNA binding protein